MLDLIEILAAYILGYYICKQEDQRYTLRTYGYYGPRSLYKSKRGAVNEWWNEICVIKKRWNEI